jgi:hypothetical protein
MTTATKDSQQKVKSENVGTTRPLTRKEPSPVLSSLTSEHVWHQLERGSFAVIGYVTPTGEPRSSGVMYRAVGRRLYVVVAPDSWKARHIVLNDAVALTVPVRRGGLLSLVLPIPPATISFHGKARVHAGDSQRVHAVVEQLGALLPAERRASFSVLEITPEGSFVTYGVHVSLNAMRDPDKARARVPVGTSETEADLLTSRRHGSGGEDDGRRHWWRGPRASSSSTTKVGFAPGGRRGTGVGGPSSPMR